PPLKGVGICQSHCVGVRLAYGSPAANDDRREMVGKSRALARHTGEPALSGTIGAVHMPAGGTSPRSIARIDERNRNSRRFRFVADELRQLVERPRGERSPLGATNRYPVADSAQVF